MLGGIVPFVETFCGKTLSALPTIKGDHVHLLSDTEAGLAEEDHIEACKGTTVMVGEKYGIRQVGSRFKKEKPLRQVYIVGVTGCSGVGKSELCRRLGDQFQSPLQLQQQQQQ